MESVSGSDIRQLILQRAGKRQRCPASLLTPAIRRNVLTSTAALNKILTLKQANQKKLSKDPLSYGDPIC